MFEIAAQIFIFSILTAILISFGLLITRIILVVKDKKTLTESLLIVLIPASIGYYHFYPTQSRFKKHYQRAVLLMFILTFIGSIYIAFLNIPELAHWFFYGL